MNFATQEIRTAAARLVDLAHELERLAELHTFIEDCRDCAKHSPNLGATLSVRITDPASRDVYEVELPVASEVFDALLKHVEHEWAASAEIRAHAFALTPSSVNKS